MLRNVFRYFDIYCLVSSGHKKVSNIFFRIQILILVPFIPDAVYIKSNAKSRHSPCSAVSMFALGNN